MAGHGRSTHNPGTATTDGRSDSAAPVSRVYRAGTLREALGRVRRDLGGSAVILGMREVRRRRLFGRGVLEQIEVTAAPELPEATPPEPPPIAIPALHSGPRLDPRLGKLHAAVDELSRGGAFEHLLLDVPTSLAPVYARLVEAEVPEAIARRLVRHVLDAVEPDEYHRPDAIEDALRRAVALCLPTATPIAAVPGMRRVVALVGPTGVGKTTTVAKLAAIAKLELGLRVGLLTVDTYRIAAVEQLRTYAEIIDLPLAVADAPDRMRGALDDLGPLDLALIDTAGRSPSDLGKIRMLGDVLEAANPDEVHLVLSAASGRGALDAAVDRFGPLGVDRLLVTKLDEAAGLGALLGVVARSARPISYVTNGQAVPDDIEPADPNRLASLILGRGAIS